MRKRRTAKVAVAAFLAAIVMGVGIKPCSIKAAETATVRIISTTDLHGQLADTNYDTAGKKNVGSLAQDYTLIKEARDEIKYGTAVTVDVGDTIYGYGSDFVHDSEDEKEYMYEAMAEMGYDAITLGNHDFDYGYSYVKRQLKNVGLDKICVVSNVFDAVTKKTPWNENRMLAKEITTSAGKKINVKIGIVGVTRPDLTTYYNHTGILTTEDIVVATKEQVEKLRKQGADLVVVLSHSSFGSENPDYFAGDATYALSKIDGVDAIMAGHGHLNFPSSDANVKKFYSYQNVDKKTGLMNGKPVIMVADHGAGIGVADLKLTIVNGKVTVAGSNANIRYAKKDTPLDKTVTKYQAIYDEIIKSTYSEVVGEMKSGEILTNYFGIIEDNAAIQLLNESKIRMGLEYSHTINTEYEDYPVIAASSFKKYGVENQDDYIHINGNITMADVLSIQSYYHNYPYVYWITGKQLKEWLEWTASAYTSPNVKQKSGDDMLDSYVGNRNMLSLVDKDWMGEWSNLSLFDGVEYEVDLTQPAKYSQQGKLINSTASRILNLSCNGSKVSDSTRFLLVSDIISASDPVLGKELPSQRLYKGTQYSTNLLKEYIEEQSSFHGIDIEADNNWRLVAPSSSSYVFRASSLSVEEAKKKSWYRGTLELSEGYAYYSAKFSQYNTDSSGPTLVVLPLIKVKTDKDVPVVIQSNDMSTTTALRYAVGEFEAKDPIWSTSVSASIENSQFFVKQNGIYSIWAMDNAGNATVKHIKISNINRGALEMPKVNRVTNKSKKVTGTANPGATIIISTPGKTYTTKVKSDGTFSRKVAFQRAGKTITVMQKDDTGKESDATQVSVLRAGPNRPELVSLDNTSTSIVVNLKDDNSQIFAYIGDKVYVSGKEGKEAFMESFYYDGTHTIVEANDTRDGDEVSMEIPVQTSGTEVLIYAVDSIGRANYPIKVVVPHVAPEMPVLYTSCDGEHFVYGYISDSKKNTYDIKVTIDGNEYKGTSDSNGQFKIDVGSLEAGQIIYASAVDVVDGSVRESASGSREVRPSQYYMNSNDQITALLNPMNDKDLTIKGLVSGFQGNIYIKAAGVFYDLEGMQNPSVEIPLAAPLKAGERITMVLRNKFGNIKLATSIVVAKSLPDRPVLVNKAIYTTTKTIKLQSKEACVANAKVGGTVYSSKKGIYDEETGIYTYKITIKKPKEKQTVYFYMENEAGKSKRIKMTVQIKEKKSE